VTAGEDDAPPSAGALKMRRHRARKATARQATAELAAGEAAPVQEALPLAPAGELEPMAPPPAPAGGRPVGATDRKAADWRAYMLARYRSPLVVLAETYSRPVAELARELDCKRSEAFAMQLRAASEAAAYLHSKAPQAVQLDGVAVAPVAIGVTAGIAARLGMTARPVVEVVENQDDSGSEGGAV